MTVHVHQNVVWFDIPGKDEGRERETKVNTLIPLREREDGGRKIERGCGAREREKEKTRAREKEEGERGREGERTREKDV